MQGVITLLPRAAAGLRPLEVFVLVVAPHPVHQVVVGAGPDHKTRHEVARQLVSSERLMERVESAGSVSRKRRWSVLRITCPRSLHTAHAWGGRHLTGARFARLTQLTNVG